MHSPACRSGASGAGSPFATRRDVGGNPWCCPCWAMGLWLDTDQPQRQEVRMTSKTITPSTNEAVWHASGAALYEGDIDAFLAYWQPDSRYEVAYPVAGLPAAVEG